MKTNIYGIIAISFIVTMTCLIFNELGKVQGAYTVDYQLCFTCPTIFTGLFICGYLAGKDHNN